MVPRCFSAEVRLETDEHGTNEDELVESHEWTLLSVGSFSKVLRNYDSIAIFSFHLQRKPENFMTSLFASYVVCEIFIWISFKVYLSL